MANAFHVCLTVEAGMPGAPTLDLNLVASDSKVTGQAIMSRAVDGGGRQVFQVHGSYSLLVFNGNSQISLTLEGQTLYVTGGTMGLHAVLSSDWGKGTATWETDLEGQGRQVYENKEVVRTDCTQA